MRSRRRILRQPLLLLCGLLLGGLSLALGSLLAADPLERAPAAESAASDAAVLSSTTPDSTASGAIAPAEFAAALRARTGPLVEAHCLECLHNNDHHEADISLEPLLAADDVNQNRELWQRVLHMVRAGAMPPEEGTPLATDDRQWLTGWIESSLDWCDCSGERDPGRVTLRRLNRAEYRNTIRDLVGIDYEPAEDFPVDGVGYGFDNIGDVLSLPPLLFEQYLDAAEEITAQAIVTNPPKPLALRIAGADLQGDAGGTSISGSARKIFRSTFAYTEVEIPVAGRYEIVIGAFGDQAGDEPAKMSLLVGEESVATFTVPQERDAPGAFTWELELPAGVQKVSIDFINDFYLPGKNRGDEALADRNLGVMFLAVNGPADFEVPEMPESHQRIFYVMPSEELSEDAAAEQILTRLAARAFRRPVTPAERRGLMRLFHQGQWRDDSFEASIQLAATAILLSPHFLFLVEGDPADAPPIRPLNDYELATRLSYFLWSSLPDDELYALAEQGQLREPGVLAEQVERMLADPRAWALTENFAGQWLHLRLLERSQPNAARFPAFNDELREDMRQETLRCFDHLVRENRSVLELLSSDYTFLNERLANLYGIEGVRGEEFRRVSLEGTPRGGVLTQASVLTSTSNPNRTSPVKRGRWVLEVLLGTPPPPPPPDAPSLAAAPQEAATLRAQLEQHRADPRCAVCHETMDPLGFALENFDAIGAWRESEDTLPIDASGALPGGASFDGPRELRQVLVERYSDQFCRAISEKMLTYALGRGLENYDRCTVDDIMKELAEGEYRLHALVQAVVASDAFRKRRTTP